MSASTPSLFTLYSTCFAMMFYIQNTSAQNFWKHQNKVEVNQRNSSTRHIIPSEYEVFSLQESNLKEVLESSPQEFSTQNKGADAGTRIDLPMPNGRTETFVVWKSLVVEDGLLAKYPSLTSYKGYNVNNKRVVTRFSLTSQGFHGCISSPEGSIYIDPYSIAKDNQYISYYTKNHVDEYVNQQVLCGTEDEVVQPNLNKHFQKNPYRNAAEKMEFRKYRIAIACTGEWGQVRGTVEAALAEMVVFLDRANIVFEQELALRAVLVANNDKIIFLNPDTDPYTTSDQGLVILGQNGNILNSIINGNNYEIGHVFSRCFDVGGVAGGNICTSGKGAGVTCHNGNAVSNSIVLVFNHEVGHQMTASHTFNRCGDTDQLALGTAFEPGSGSTILSYAGACGSDNLGVSREAYYHGASLEQMLSFTNTPNAAAYLCAEKIDINNFFPTIDLPYSNGFSIPRSTPFFLQGSATDPENDTLTYVWEQFDNQMSVPLGSPSGNCPLFRSLKSTTSPKRYFPSVNNIFNRRFTENTEYLPTYGRNLTFRFIVRDNHFSGNATTWEELSFKVAPNAGPFVITSPVTTGRYKVGQSVEVLWDVANTDIAPVNCKNVDIYLSYGNSLDFDSDNLVLLLGHTPNDGKASVIIPNKVSPSTRFVIKASDNIFLTTSIEPSIVELPTTPAIFTDIEVARQDLCLPLPANYEFTTSGLNGFTGNINFEVVSGLPQGAVATFSQPSVAVGEKTILSINLDDVKGTNMYTVIVRAIADGIDTLDREVLLNVTGTDLNSPFLSLPANGVAGLGPTQKFSWERKVDATSYELEVATSPDFNTNNIVITQSNLTDTFYISNTFLEKATVYYWRVRTQNSCKIGDWSKTSAYSTEASNCYKQNSGIINLQLSGTGTPIVESMFELSNEGTISDVNVKSMRGFHNWVGDLEASIISPAGTEVILWSKKCSSVKSFAVGCDDQSNEFFQCPINTNRVYRPEQPLSAFNGESMKGKWIVRIADKELGNGGRFESYEVEFCSNVALSPPILINNNQLEIHPGDSKIINTDLLLSTDNDNTADQLIYTLVTIPTKGQLFINGQIALVGSTYTQSQINDQSIVYRHTSGNDEDDLFLFTVKDDKGGWVEITEFTIIVDSSFPSSTTNIESNNSINIYPNPAKSSIQLGVSGSQVDYTHYEIRDILGKVISKAIYVQNQNINISLLTEGVYIITLLHPKGNVSSRFIKIE